MTTRIENRKSLILIAICICISLIVPISQRAASQKLQDRIAQQRSVVYSLSEEKISLQAEIAGMNTVETLMAIGNNIDIRFAQIPSVSTMVASSN